MPLSPRAIISNIFFLKKISSYSSKIICWETQRTLSEPGCDADSRPLIDPDCLPNNVLCLLELSLFHLLHKEYGGSLCYTETISARSYVLIH